MKVIKLFFLLVSVLIGECSWAQEFIELSREKGNKVIVRFQFKNGSISDPDGMEGLSYFSANWIVDGGTTSMSKSEIDDFIYPMAAGYSASVDKEVVNFTFRVPTDFLHEFYPVMRNLILNPAFDEKDFDRVKSRQENFIKKTIKSSSDEDYSKYALENLLYRGTKYAHPVQGTAKSVEAITPEAAKKHYHKFFTKDNLTIGIAGKYDKDFIIRLKEDMAAMPELKVELPESPYPRLPDGLEVEIISKPDAFGSAIFMGYPLPITREDEDFAALMVANSFLGEHRKSYGLLYQEIREKRSMNYGDYSYIEWYPHGSSNMLPLSGYPRKSNYCSMWIRPVQTAEKLKEQYPELADIKTGHAHFAIRMAVYEMQQLIDNGITRDEFELTRTFLRSYIKLYVNTLEQQLGYRMDSHFYGMDRWTNEIDNQLAELTPDDVNEALRKYWQTENMCIAIITSEDEAENLAKSLKNNWHSPMSYNNSLKEGLNEEIFQKDDRVSKLKLNIQTVENFPSKEMFVE